MSDKRRWLQIQLTAGIMLMLIARFAFAGDTPAPLWDGHESVADYAQRVNLPPTKTLDLGNGVKLELVLIPAGKFIMGTPEPTPMDEEGFHKTIVTGQALLVSSAAALLIMLTVVIVRAVRQKRRPQLSLGLLMLVTVAAGGCVLSGLHWRNSVEALKKENAEYAEVKARYNSSDSDGKPTHPVTLTQPFYMGKFPVTQEQWQQITGQNPSQFKGRDNPVEKISWNDAQAFCKTLSRKTNQVRLPTEAEWEFACRAGTKTAYYSGNTEADLNRVAWYDANSKSTHPVGQKVSNTFGLFDMHGNVWQWCQDCFEDYTHSLAENPQGGARGPYRLLRGGCWDYDPLYCESAHRHAGPPDCAGYGLGFRVVLVPPSRSP